MPDVVEIYICKPGQALKDGRLVVSNDIYDRDAAKADAAMRCKVDPTIARIAYYTVNDAGDFRVFHSYNNPNVQAAKPKTVARTARKKRKPKKPVKKTLWRKIKAMVAD